MMAHGSSIGEESGGGVRRIVGAMMRRHPSRVRARVERAFIDSESNRHAKGPIARGRSMDAMSRIIRKESHCPDTHRIRRCRLEILSSACGERGHRPAWWSDDDRETRCQLRDATFNPATLEVALAVCVTHTSAGWTRKARACRHQLCCRCTGTPAVGFVGEH